MGSTARVSFPDQDDASVLASESVDDPGTNLEDELCHFSPLQETIFHFRNPMRTVTISIPAPAVPDMCSLAPATQISPAPLRVVNSLPTIDVFPTYTTSPAVSYYAGYCAGNSRVAGNVRLCLARESDVNGQLSRG